jgi:hypothetical protein
MNDWFVGSKVKRFRIPIWWNWGMNVPQPRWLKRWYYKKSYQWWNHPSNHHWKGCLIGASNRNYDGYVASSRLISWLDGKCSLRPGERDIWGGGYCDSQQSQETYDRR